jgi:hypothetical protein
MAMTENANNLQVIYEEDIGLANIIGVVQAVNSIVRAMPVVSVKGEDGIVVSNKLASINFVGDGVSTATDKQGNIIVTVEGGSSASNPSGTVDGGNF